LREHSGLEPHRDFDLGYSPERLSPGGSRGFADIVKVTAGGTPRAAERVDALYRSVVTAGTHRAPDIRTAEAAKVLENAQRDVNIALVNEIAVLFARLELDTHAVLAAAGTKWNFLPFTPGLVGGHCIGVDPYYLIHKAAQVGSPLHLLQAAREINNRMGFHIADQVLLLLARRPRPVPSSRVLVLGATFKENCTDVRNTRTVDIRSRLAECGVEVDVHDPHADPDEFERHYGFPLLAEPAPGSYDALIVAVAHDRFRAGGLEAIQRLGVEGALVYDVKRLFPSLPPEQRL
jgi:UDP-N-acetyl-D-galactosamine dehydrogenase